MPTVSAGPPGSAATETAYGGVPPFAPSDEEHACPTRAVPSPGPFRWSGAGLIGNG